MAGDMDSVGLNGGRGKFRRSFVDRFFFFGGLVPGFLKRSNLHLSDDHVSPIAVLQVALPRGY